MSYRASLCALMLMACGGTSSDTSADTDETDETDGMDETDETDSTRETDTDTMGGGGDEDVPSTDYQVPVSLDPDDPFSASITGTANPEDAPTHFFRFSPTVAGTYVGTLTGPSGLSATWCEGPAGEFGCLCNLVQGRPTPCCTIMDGASCTFTLELDDTSPTDVIVFPLIPVTMAYTLEIGP